MTDPGQPRRGPRGRPTGASPTRAVWKRAALVVLAATATAAIAVATVGAIVGAPQHQQHLPSSPASTAHSTARPTRSASLACSTRSAHALAARAFDWDSGSQSRQDVIRRVVAVADPSGVETPGLLADLDDYLPDADVWRQLAVYRTRQTLTGIKLTVPRSWATTVHARLGAGTAAFTVLATRTRSGVVSSRRVTSSDRVEFTMFLRCPPSRSGGEYRLLRLSQLGHPLP